MLGTRWKWYSDSTPDNIFLIDSFVFLHKSNMIASIISTWIFLNLFAQQEAILWEFKWN